MQTKYLQNVDTKYKSLALTKCRRSGKGGGASLSNCDYQLSVFIRTKSSKLVVL